MSNKTKNIIGWILTTLLIFIFGGSALMKLFGNNEQMAGMLGGTANMYVLGVVEIISIALFIYKRTSLVGALLLIAYMGGAMAVSLTSGQPILMTTVFQILIWITASIRIPEFTSRLLNK